ncbi:MAG TPA: DUF1800 domain-containing protein [Mycobacteriales bacterium]|nr:DUF1800 domain-containing protein [Mycobacteriales bacterium]
MIFESGLGRRGLLAGAAATAAGAALLPSGASAAVVRPAPARGIGVAGRPPADMVSADPYLHVLRRCTYGPTPAAVAEIRALGVSSWLEKQLAPASIDDSAFDAVLGRYPQLKLDVTGVRAAVDAGTVEQYGWELMYQLGQTTLARAAWSRRQLLEVMVDFWSNQLNVTNPFDGGWDNRHVYDRDVIRKHAFGRFADLLKASATSPAMLAYLDNQSSTKDHPNENYARELMELHTVGVDAGYTEDDVQAAARLLTGLTVNWETGLYRYDASEHATGRVSILGFTHANATAAGGRAAAMAFLDHLALHPATARQIAYKLCVRFVADAPPTALVNRLAAVYLKNSSAIAPVLRALFTSAEFRNSVGAKVRRPMQDVIATVRALGIGPDPSGTKGIEGLYWMVAGTGDAPMGWHPPNGYPDVAPAWASAAGTLSRWNAHISLAAEWWPTELGHQANLRTYLVPKLPATHGGLVDALAVRLLGIKLRPGHTAAITEFLGKKPASALRSTDPAVHWRFPAVVSLVLDSPYFSFR